MTKIYKSVFSQPNKHIKLLRHLLFIRQYEYIYSVNKWENPHQDLVNCDTMDWLSGWDYSDRSLNKEMKKKYKSKQNLLKLLYKRYSKYL